MRSSRRFSKRCPRRVESSPHLTVAPGEFHYRLPHRLGTWRPGSHPATSLGTGQEFVSHANLLDRPDPRRLDLRASLRDIRGDWLVRVHRQRAAVPVQVIVDVSASMAFGAHASEAAGRRGFRRSAGPERLSRRRCARHGCVRRARANGFVRAAPSWSRQRHADGLTLEELHGRWKWRGWAPSRRLCTTPGRAGLIFLVSDFHWPLDRLERTLDLLRPRMSMPMVVWDPAETQPPAENGLLSVWDVESRSQRTLWMRRSLRARWIEAVDAATHGPDGAPGAPKVSDRST